MGIMTLHDLMDTFHTLRRGAPGRAVRGSHVCVGVPEEPGRLHEPAGAGRLRLRGGIHLRRAGTMAQVYQGECERCHSFILMLLYF